MSRLDYLKQYSSDYTTRNYKTALRNFFESVYKERNGLEELAERYFQDKRNYEEDIQNFLAEIKDKAPKTVMLQLSAIRMFLLENKVELSQEFWRRLRGRVKGSRALTIDKIPTNEELRKIITHLPVQGKALYLMLSSSGMRIGEALKLNFEDIDLEADPVRINLLGKYTKSGNSRVTFISREAGETVKEWLKVRKEYLGSAIARSRHKKLETKEIFPFSESNALYMWNIALRKTKNGKRDTQTNIHLFHPHVLRKFFRTKFASVIQFDIVEALMGHEGYLTEVYRRYQPEDLAKFYKQGEPSILIFGGIVDFQQIQMQVDAKVDDKIGALQKVIDRYAAENLELKSRIAGVELEIIEVKKALEKLVS